MGVVEPFDVVEHRGSGLVPCGKVCLSRSSVSRVAKNDSATALSYASPLRPIDMAMPAPSHRATNAADVYWLPLSEWWMTLSGRRVVMAMSRASVTNGVAMSSRMDQPTTRRDQTSRTVARYRNPARVGT